MYYALTIGTLADEFVRHIAGRSVAEVLKAEVTGPRKIYLFMGTPASKDGRVVEAQLPTAEEIAAGPVPSDSGDPLGSRPLPIGNVFDLLGEANSERSRRVGMPRLLSDETIA